MSRICQLCNKRKQYGRQSRHKKGVAGKQWSKRAQSTLRIYDVNLQHATIDGQKMLLCAKCLKLLKGKKTSPKEAVKAINPKVPAVQTA